MSQYLCRLYGGPRDGFAEYHEAATADDLPRAILTVKAVNTREAYIEHNPVTFWDNTPTMRQVEYRLHCVHGGVAIYLVDWKEHDHK